MNTLNKYGYKVYYKERGKIFPKLFSITNSYDLALIDIKRCKTNVKCYIKPIKSYIEYKYRWKNCPF